MGANGKRSRKARRARRKARRKEKRNKKEATGEEMSAFERVAARAGTVYVWEGVPEFLVDGQWHRVPNNLWAWSPNRTTYRRCRECGFCDDCQYEFWYDDDYVRHLTRNT